MGELTELRGRGALLEPNAQLPEWLRQRLNLLSNDYPPQLAGAPLSEAERSYCQRCLTSLKSHFEPADINALGLIVAKLLSAFPSADTADSVARARGEAYLIALEGAPLWAVEEAYRRVLRGDAAVSQRFMPTPPELRCLVNDISRPARWQAKRLEHLLDAKTNGGESAVNIERGRELMAAIMLQFPEPRKRGMRNPAGVNHSDKGGF